MQHPQQVERLPALVIDKYELVRRIGSGGFGDVFLGRDTVIKRPVAIKLCSSPDRSLIQRFEREVKIVGGLRHPNITTLHDSGTYGNVPYLVQEYLPGEDLEQQIRACRPTPPSRRLDVLVQAGRGLEHAHSRGVVHRDVKPSNVRVLEDGTVKILDFGIARLTDSRTRLTQTGARVGTMCYMAPEQLRGEDVDARADIFAFGVLAFELLTHRHPFPAESHHAVVYQVLEAAPLELRALWPECPKRLATCIHRCLEKDPRDRPPSIRAILDVLENVDMPDAPPRRLTGDTTAKSVPRLLGVRRRRRRVLLPLLAAAALVAVMVLGPSLLPPAPPPLKETPSPEQPAFREEPVRVAEARPTAETSTLQEAFPSEEKPAEAAPVPSDAAPEKPRDIRLPPADVPPPVESAPEPPPPAAPTPASPTPASPTLAQPVAKVADVPRGHAVIDARPWAMVSRVVAEDGKVYTPGSSNRYTPLAVRLPEGNYTVVLNHPAAGEGSCELAVLADGSAACEQTFAQVDAKAFFQSNPLRVRGSNERAVAPRTGGLTAVALPPPPPRGGGGRGGDRRGGGGRGGGGRGGAPPPQSALLLNTGASGQLDASGQPVSFNGPRSAPSYVPPRWLRKAAQTFFDGNYDEVAGDLASKKARSREAAFFARLFLGAALHGRFLTGEEGDPEILRAAVAQLRECHQLFPSFMPHVDYFSPSFIEFYTVYSMPPAEGAAGP